MPMRRSTLLLLCASAVALFAGLAPLATRWYQGYAEHARIEAQQADLQRQVQAQAAELQARKPEILAELTRLQSSGEHAMVITLAGRYRLADDAEVRAIHARSAQALNLRQTQDRMAALAAEHCTESSTRQMVESLFTEAYPGARMVSAQDWLLQKMVLSEFEEPIRSRVREWASVKPSEHAHSHGHSHGHEPKASALDALRGDHAPRVSPAVIFSIMQGLRMEELACVWRVKGKVDLNHDGKSSPKPFDLVVWMAPSATERGMERDVLSVRGLH